MSTLSVISDTYIGDKLELVFGDSSTVLAEEVRPQDRPPYFLVPATTSLAQASAIKTWSHLAVVFAS